MKIEWHNFDDNTTFLNVPGGVILKLTKDERKHVQVYVPGYTYDNQSKEMSGAIISWDIIDESCDAMNFTTGMVYCFCTEKIQKSLVWIPNCNYNRSNIEIEALA